jgi:hypothetical protein
VIEHELKKYICEGGEDNKENRKNNRDFEDQGFKTPFGMVGLAAKSTAQPCPLGLNENQAGKGNRQDDLNYGKDIFHTRVE